MAGSLRTFAYTSDSGLVFLYTGDESNNEAVNGATSAPTEAQLAAQTGIPRNMRPRTLRYSSGTTTRVLKVVAATSAIFNAPPATIPDGVAGTGTLALSGRTGEKVRLFKGIDSGLTDGDAPL